MIITQNYLSINIATSKTDQFGKGTKTYIYDNEKPWCPLNFVDVLQNFKDDDKIFTKNQYTLRTHLQFLLRSIGINDYKEYSWHSFRRGGAYYAGVSGVSDSIIKAHGRWKSTAYIRYVSVKMSNAGLTISNAFKNQ